MGNKILLNAILKRGAGFLSNTPLVHKLLNDLSPLLKQHNKTNPNEISEKQMKRERECVFTFPDEKVSALKARRTE